MAYIDQWNLIREGSALRARATVALADILPDIYFEVDTTPKHTERLAWAEYASHNLAKVLDQMFPLVVAHDYVQTNGESIADQDLKTVLSSLVNIFAVFYYNNLTAGSTT